MTTHIDLRSWFRAALTAAALCVPVLAHADDTKPALSIKTKSIEASVSIERLLKAYPGLYDNLLAEGRREMEKWRVSADKDRKDAPEAFANSRRYSFKRSYTQRSEIGRYVSVERDDYLNNHGPTRTAKPTPSSGTRTPKSVSASGHSSRKPHRADPRWTASRKRSGPGLLARRKRAAVTMSIPTPIPSWPM